MVSNISDKESKDTSKKDLKGKDGETVNDKKKKSNNSGLQDSNEKRQQNSNSTEEQKVKQPTPWSDIVKKNPYAKGKMDTTTTTTDKNPSGGPSNEQRSNEGEKKNDETKNEEQKQQIRKSILEDKVPDDDATRHPDGTPINLDPTGRDWVQDLLTCGAGHECKAKTKILNINSRCASCGWCCHEECGARLVKNRRQDIVIKSNFKRICWRCIKEE